MKHISCFLIWSYFVMVLGDFIEKANRHFINISVFSLYNNIILNTCICTYAHIWNSNFFTPTLAKFKIEAVKISQNTAGEIYFFTINKSDIANFKNTSLNIFLIKCEEQVIVNKTTQINITFQYRLIKRHSRNSIEKSLYFYVSHSIFLVS